MTCFKFTKKFSTEYLLSKSEGSNSNGTTTQKFIRHLPFILFQASVPNGKGKKNAIPNPYQMNSSKDREEENEQKEICFTQINLINLTPMSLFNTHRHKHGRNQQVNKQERKNYEFLFSSFI
jgi:hypothetical protein